MAKKLKRKGKASFVTMTASDCTVCPYCGCLDTDFIDAWTNEDSTEEESRQCFNCNEYYNVTFGDDEDVIDVCSHNNFSLLKEAKSA